MESAPYPRAVSAFIAASRGYRHDTMSTDDAYADMVADAHAANVNGKSCPFDTGRPHGPIQWLEPAPMMSPVPQHIQDRMFTPVQTMRGQTTLGEI